MPEIKLPPIDSLVKCVHDVPFNQCATCMLAAGLGPKKQAERRRATGGALRGVQHVAAEGSEAIPTEPAPPSSPRFKVPINEDKR